jgi:phosphohistidine swiveling domain-containing protein
MLIPLERATPQCGGKASGLRRLLELGLPVPPGRCLPVELYRSALPAVLPAPDAADEAGSRPVVQSLEGWEPSPGLRQALDEAGQQLGWPLVVRSSATCEAAAPGLFVSVNGVGEIAALVAAIRRCWASLWSTPAWVVLRHRGSWPGAEGMAVVLQHEVHASWAGLALSRDAQQTASIRVELVPGSGGALAAGAADPQWVLVPREGVPPSSALPHAALVALRDAALRAEEIWGAPVELEWALAADGAIQLVQVRPTAVASPPAGSWAVDDGQTTWRWDREHNPEPLSVAHASLMDLVAPPGGHRIVEGYLYYAERGEPPAEIDPDLEQLWDGFTREMVPRLQAFEARTAPLDQVLDFFRELYAAYFGDLARARQRARAEVARFLREALGADERTAARLSTPADHATVERTSELFRLAGALREDPELAAFVRGPQPDLRACPSAAFARAVREHLVRYGTLVACWDVAAPTLAEQPELLLRRVAALAEATDDPAAAWQQLAALARAEERALRERLAADDRARLDDLLRRARLARRVEEEDDLLFSRAMALVRRALLARGEQLVARGLLARADDVFLLSMEELQAGLPTELGSELSSRRAAWEARRRLMPPLTIRGSSASWARPAGDSVLRGLGVGGTARGRVRLVTRMEQLLAGDLGGAVVVCPTLLPALAVVLPEVAALVTDHGGLLSHAASLARELGVVAVVGTGSATRVLRDGEKVWVDGQRGLVVREAPGRL